MCCVQCLEHSKCSINITYYIWRVCTWFTKQRGVIKGFWAEELYVWSWNSRVISLPMRLNSWVFHLLATCHFRNQLPCLGSKISANTMLITSSQSFLRIKWSPGLFLAISMWSSSDTRWNFSSWRSLLPWACCYILLYPQSLSSSPVITWTHLAPNFQSLVKLYRPLLKTLLTPKPFAWTSSASPPPLPPTVQCYSFNSLILSFSFFSPLFHFHFIIKILIPESYLILAYQPHDYLLACLLTLNPTQS